MSQDKLTHATYFISHRWAVEQMWIAVSRVDELPYTLSKLHLGIAVDAVSGRAMDPGLEQLSEHCPNLEGLRK